MDPCRWLQHLQMRRPRSSLHQVRLCIACCPLLEALESGMCDVIKICVKRRDATRRNGKGNQPLNIKTTVEWPILKLGLPNFRFY